MRAYLTKLVKGKYVLILFLLGFLPATWFRSGYLLRSEEVGYLDYSNLYTKYSFAWSEHSTNGAPASYSNHLALFPVGLMYKIFSEIGVSSLIAQHVVLVVYFQVALFSIYLLARYITKNRWAAFCAAIFYGSTFYMLSTFFYTAKMIQMAITPLLFYLFLRYLEKGTIRYAISHFFVLLLCMGLFANPANGLVSLLTYPIVFLYHSLMGRRTEKADLFKRTVFFFVPSLPIFAYVASVYYFSVFVPGLYSSIRQENAFANTFLSTRISSVMQNFKGAWWESQEVYNPWISLLSNRVSIFSSLILSALMFVGFYTIKETSEKRKYTFWLLFFLILLFFVKGFSEPFGFIYNGLFKFFQGFFIFRESWAKFSPMLILLGSLAFSLSIRSLDGAKNTVFSKYARYIVLILLFINARPFFVDGPFNRPNDKVNTSIDVKIPDYWNELKSWSKDNTSVNVLPLPIMYGSQEYYKWYSDRTGNFTGYLPTSLLFSNSISVRDSGFQVQKALFKYYSPRLTSLLNIDYVLMQGDVGNAEPQSPYTVSNLILSEVLEKEPNKSFGKLDLYKVSDSYRLPRIYIADAICHYIGDSTTMSLALDLPDLPASNKRIYVNSWNSDDDYQLGNEYVSIPVRVKTIKNDFSIWSKGWPWPATATINPTDRKYALVRIKEEVSLALTRDQFQKIDLELWLATKRITEMRTYNLTSSKQKEIYGKYVDTMKSVFARVMAIKEDGRNDEFWGVIRKVIMYSDRSLQALHAAGIAVDVVKVAEDAHDDFVLWVEDAANPTCTDFCFEVTPRQSGTHDLLLSKNGLEGMPYDEVSVEVYDYTEKKKYIVKRQDDLWFDFGPLDLSAGQEYKLGFTFPDAQNLISTEDWKTDDSVVYFDRLEIKPQNVYPKSSIFLSNKYQERSADEPFYIYDSLIFHKPIENWEPGKHYEITFDYCTESSKLGIAVVEEVADFNVGLRWGDSKIAPIDRKVIFRNEIESVCDRYEYLVGVCKSQFRNVVTAGSYSKGAVIYVYARASEKDRFSDVLLDKLKVSKIWEPHPFVKFGKVEEKKSSPVSFVRLSPVKYNVKIKDSNDSRTLVFSQNYNVGWRLYRKNLIDRPVLAERAVNFLDTYFPITDNKEFIPNHYVANGYANAWLIPADFEDMEGTELIIEYWPQRYFNAVTYTIVIFIILFISYACYSLSRAIVYFLGHRNDRRNN